MMLGVSDSSGNSSGGAASGNQEGDAGVVGGSITVASDAGGGIGGGGEDEKLRNEEGDRNSTGNRWPRQETMALLKIRSDMDVAFRDSTLKGPLWEEISRKLAELGFHRSAKKCKEKFENVFKYHKRTKEGRAARPDGKSYRFFDQLQALDHHQPSLLPPLSPPKPVLQSQSQSPAARHPMPISATPSAAVPPSPMPIAATPTAVAPPTMPPPNVMSREIVPASTPTTTTTTTTTPTTTKTADPVPNSSSPLTSSSSSSEDESGGGRSRSRKRKKLTDFFEKLMNDVIEKQEMLQKKFLEAIEKRERERVAREEAWKIQEMARMNREHEMIMQERSIAAAKDAAVIAFLQKISEQASPAQSSELLLQLHESQKPNPSPNPIPAPTPISIPISTPTPSPTPTPTPTPIPSQQQAAQPPSSQAQPSPEKMLVAISRPPPDNAADSFAATTSGGGGGSGGASSSRWPKPEVQALIKLRTSLDVKYQENGPKGPLWEEISASMRKLGYNRNAKRCKEKWENINKYFKKVKESNKKRPEESKTCPYFHQLDALYKEKSQMQLQQQKMDSSSSNNPMGMGMGPYGVKPENMVMPLRQEPLRPHSDVESENNTNMEMEPNQEQEDGDDEDDDDEGGDFEIVANNSSSMAIVE